MQQLKHVLIAQLIVLIVLMQLVVLLAKLDIPGMLQLEHAQ